MGAPYSYDLREKVMQAIDKGMRKSEVSRVFNLSRNTAACLRGKLPPQNCLIDLWLKRREETGNYQASVGYQKGSRHKITDWRKFQEFAQKNGEKTQAEMTQVWEGELSRYTISRGLKKINFTRKKRPMGTKKEMNLSAKNSELNFNSKT